jgi:predicted dehydrogenase
LDRRAQLDVRPLITHHFAIQEAAKAYALITGKKAEPFLGVLLTYPQNPLPDAMDRRVVNYHAAAVSIKPGELLALGVLGAGNYASAVFLPVVHQAGGVAPIGIVSSSGVSAQHAAQRFGFGYATSSDEQLLSDPSINLIAILTRHQHHTRQVLAALKAGKRVFCEKPLAITQEQLDEMANYLSQEPHPLLAVGFNRRFAPLAVRLKEFASQRSEPLIANYRVNAGYLPPNHWLHDPAQGGGRIIGEACHFIDFLTFLVGSVPCAVTACALPDQNRYREENVILTLTFPDGSIGAITYLANGDKAFGKERLEVFSSGWSAVLDDFRSLELVRKGKRRLTRSILRQDKGHRAGWQAFIEACRKGGPPPIPYDQLLGVSQIAITAVEVLRNGQVSACLSPDRSSSAGPASTPTGAQTGGPEPSQVEPPQVEPPQEASLQTEAHD